MTDRQMIELIGIRAYRLNTIKSKPKYKLIDIDEWSKEICEELNNSSFDKEYEFKPEENNKFKDKTDELRENFSLIFEYYEKKKSNEIKIYMYPDLVTDFVRFDYKIILKEVLDKEELSKIINDCQDSIKNHILLLNIITKIRDELLKCEEPIINYSAAKNKLKDLREICAISAYFSSDKKKYSENNIWHELLQNANDHISEEIMEVSIDDSKLCLEYAEKQGFTVKDFYAIATEGNSGNESSIENREGRKGTGFKSVYKYFDKVEISSGPVICELKYDKELTISIESDKQNSHELNFQKHEYDYYYPIPNFKENKDDTKKTKIILYYKKDTKENILETIFGKKTIDFKDFKQNFEQKNDYLFLQNIKKFKFTLDGTTEDVDRCRYIEEHFHIYEECINIENENEVLKSNIFWEKRSKDEAYKDKKKVSILFPKSVDKYSEQKNSVFCTLPIDSSNINLPFYINIPLLELQENRKNISNNHSDNYNFKEWNTKILEAVFKEDGPIYKAFDNLLGDIGDHLYKYFPYHYLKYPLWDNFCIKEFIKKYRFIRTICNKNISYKSINDMEDEHNTFIFLPEFMYKWFNDKDKSQDSNNTSESKLQNFNTTIPFVYYDELKDRNEIIKMLQQYYDTNITNRTNITIIDDISKYIQNIASLYKEKSESEKSKFIKLLQDIEKEYNKDNLKDNLKEVLCRALLLSMDDYDENITYQCFGNIGLEKGKYHEIHGKPSIEKFADKISNNFKFFGNDILSAIKNLELSPYLDRKQKIKSFVERSEIEEIEKIDKKILCSCTEDIIFNHWNDDYITTLKTWVDDGGILYLKSENPIDLSKSIYYTSKNIDNIKVLKIDNNKIENLKKIGIKSLDDAIKNVDFYKDANIGLIESVLKEYKDACLSAIKEYLENTDKSSNNELDKLLLEHYISYIEEYNSPLKWSKKIEKIIDKLEKKTLLNNKYKNAIFDFSNEKLNELPQSLKNKFNNTVSDKEKNKTSDFDECSISKLIEKIYLLDCLNKNKSLYCKAKYKEDENIVVIFNENSFGSLLSSEFDIKSFNQGIKFIDMISGPPNALLGSKDHALLTIKEKEEVEKYAEKIYKQYKDKLLNHFIQYWDIPIWGSEKKWINAQGYGNYEHEDKTCPLCGSILIAESSLLKIGYLSYTKKVDLENKNYNLPFPMCPNCFKSFKYADQVCLSLDCNKSIEDYLALDDIKMQEIDVCFDMYASKKKFIEKVKLSFFTRHIWNIILKS